MPHLLTILFLFFVSVLAHAEDGRDDYDLDDDGLIEINDLDDLNEIRNNLDGTSLYGNSAGCPADGCVGFELTRDLDFDTNGDGQMDEQDAYWNQGEGWVSIGDRTGRFSAEFHGNGYLILNLHIDRPNTNYQGLFGYTDGAKIRHVGLRGRLMRISGLSFIGGFVGSARNTVVEGVFSTGSVHGNGGRTGGLVGNMLDYSSVRSSFSSGPVFGVEYVGGLIGDLHSGELHTSYAIGSVEGVENVGGLTGINRTLHGFEDSYWAVDLSRQPNSDSGVGAFLSELRCPQIADDADCADSVLYEGWDQAVDVEGNAYWDFGTNQQLPALVISGNTYRDSDGDRVLDDDDKFPLNRAGSEDSDGDGAIDAWRPSCDAACRQASGLVLDQFPNNPSASVDQDLDGFPDEWNGDCGSTCREESGLTLDSHPGDGDNDGVADSEHPHFDGLIDIENLEELHAMRYALDGKGQRMSADDEVDVSGCPTVVHESTLERRCRGYELVKNLNFDTNGDGVLNEKDAYWNEGEGWNPVGVFDNGFSAEFHGNGYLILNLYINRPERSNQGLIAFADGAKIENLGLTGRFMSVSASGFSGGLAGETEHTVIEGVFSTGSVRGSGDRVGGLVGYVDFGSSIRHSFVSGSAISGSDYIGGVAGELRRSEILSSYATGRIEGEHRSGGLVGGGSSSSVTNSHWAVDLSSQSDSKGGTGALLSELQCPQAAGDTVCTDSVLYDNWGQAVDAEGHAYWDFGTDQQLPALVLSGTTYRDSDGDGVLDNDDKFPSNPAASFDTDGDGHPDSWSENCDALCQSDSDLTLDTDKDGDGVDNDADAFPLMAAASVDADADGLPDAWHEGCDSGCRADSGLILDGHINDTDNDGVVNDEDDLPFMAEASVDTDGDGHPDVWNENCDASCQSNSSTTLDEDNDNDGFDNEDDAFPLIAAASVDADNDGYPDAWHEDCDSDCQSDSGLTLDEHLDDTDNDGVSNINDTYPDDPERWEDEQAPEMVEVPDPMKVAATGRWTWVTLSVQDLLGYDDVDDEVEYEVSLKGELLSLISDNRVDLPAGALSLQWRAVDDAGNRSEPMEQSVDVYPLVRFAQSEETTGENREVRIPVSLSGASPDYPIEIKAAWIESESTVGADDLVTDGEEGIDPAELTLVIESADELDEAAMVIPVAEDSEVEPEEVLTLEIQSARAGENGDAFDMPVDGERRRHELAITDENLAPSLSLVVLQGDEQVEVVDPNAGEVTIEATVEDPNGNDEHTIEWQTEGLPAAPGDSFSFSFDPWGMDEGDYEVSATVFDNGNPVLSSDSVSAEWTLEETVDSGEEEDTSDDETEDQTGDEVDQDPPGNNTGGSSPSSGGGGSGGGGQVSLWLLMLVVLVGLSREWCRRRGACR